MACSLAVVRRGARNSADAGWSGRTTAPARRSLRVAPARAAGGGGSGGKGAEDGGRGKEEGSTEPERPDLKAILEEIEAATKASAARADANNVSDEERARREASQADFEATMDDRDRPGLAEQALGDLPLPLVRLTLIVAGVVQGMRCLALLQICHYPAMVYLEGNLWAPLAEMQTWQTAVFGDACLLAAGMLTLPMLMRFWLRELYATQTALAVCPSMKERKGAKRHALLLLVCHLLSLLGYTMATTNDFPAAGIALVALAHLAFFGLARVYIAALAPGARPRDGEIEAAVRDWKFSERLSPLLASAAATVLATLAMMFGVDTPYRMRLGLSMLWGGATLTMWDAVRRLKANKIGMMVGRDFSAAPPGVSTRPRPFSVSVPKWFQRLVIDRNRQLKPKQDDEPKPAPESKGDTPTAGSSA